MRIGLIVYGPLSQISGGYLYDRQIVAGLENRGHRVEVANLPARPYPSALLDNFRPRAFDNLFSAKVELVIEDELCHPSLIGRAYAGRAGARPRVALVHHLRHLEAHRWPLPSLYRAVERRYLRAVNGAICTSQASVRAVERTVGHSLRTAVAYPGRDHLDPGIDQADIRRRALRHGPLRLLFVGSLSRRKRPHLLIDALSHLPEGSWQLEMVGRTDVEAATTRSIRRRIAGDRQLAHSIQLRGAISDQDLRDGYRRSDVLCVPSQLEGFGIVYLEAMGFGLPVLAAANGGASELVEPGKTGCLIDSSDPLILARCLEGYLRDRQLLLSHSLAARARWEQHPRWRDSAAIVAGFLSQLIEGG